MTLPPIQNFGILKR